MTRQRQTILEELRSAGSHPSADEVYARVRKRLPHISLGTIYRNLEILCEHGLAKKLEYGQRRYDGRLENHYHVRCLRCGNIQDVQAGRLSELEQNIGRETDFIIVGHRLEFIGICPDCHRKEPDAGILS